MSDAPPAWRWTPQQVADSDPAATGLMQGFPPPPERRVDTRNWMDFPQVRWSVRNGRRVLAHRGGAPCRRGGHAAGSAAAAGPAAVHRPRWHGQYAGRLPGHHAGGRLHRAAPRPRGVRALPRLDAARRAAFGRLDHQVDHRAAGAPGHRPGPDGPDPAPAPLRARAGRHAGGRGHAAAEPGHGGGHALSARPAVQRRLLGGGRPAAAAARAGHHHLRLHPQRRCGDAGHRAGDAVPEQLARGRHLGACSG